MTFSEKLVKLRKIKGLTQDELASAVGVSRQAVYKWESGQSYPEVSKLLEIKLLFGLSIDDLLDETFEVIVPEKKRRKRLPKAVTEVIEQARAEEKVYEQTPAPVYAKSEVEEEPAPVVEEAPAPVAEPATEEDAAPVAEPVAEKDAAPAAEPVAEKDAAPAAEPATEEEPAHYADNDLFAPESEQIAEKKEEKRGFFSRIFGRK